MLQGCALQGEGCGVKGRAIIYSEAEIKWLEANRTMPIGDYHAGFTAAFGRTDVTAVNLHSLRKRKGWRTGRTGRFDKGQASWNKGKAHPSRGRSVETQFKKGVRQGVAVKLYKPIGTERISKDGYVERKIHDGMPLQSRWRAVHLIRWEEAFGALPKGYALKCLDGDKGNTDPSNWTAIPRALLPRLNGGNQYRELLAFDQADPAVRPALLMIAKLEHRARGARKGTRA